MSAPKKPENVLPTDDRVLLEVLEGATKTPGGIEIPATAQEKSHRGKVAAVGPGRLLDNGQRSPCSVFVGQTVLVKEHVGTEIKIDDRKFMLLRDGEILAVICE